MDVNVTYNIIINNKNKRFILFCVVGAISTIIDLFFLYIGVNILGLNLFISATLSFGIASINGYLLNQRLTFKRSKDASLAQYIQFMIVSVVGLILTIILLYSFTKYLHIYYIIAKLITVLIVVFWNYFANVFWTFKDGHKNM